MWNDQLILAALARIERQLGAISRSLGIILTNERRDQMATQETLARLNAAVAADRDAVNATKVALAGYVATVTELTAKLQAAIQGDDEQAVIDAAAALEANNADLQSAIPQTAAAVVQNTPASPDASAPQPTSQPTS